jgi:hypothetical protein
MISDADQPFLDSLYNAQDLQLWPDRNCNKLFQSGIEDRQRHQVGDTVVVIDRTNAGHRDDGGILRLGRGRIVENFPVITKICEVELIVPGSGYTAA